MEERYVFLIVGVGGHVRNNFHQVGTFIDSGERNGRYFPLIVGGRHGNKYVLAKLVRPMYFAGLSQVGTFIDSGERDGRYFPLIVGGRHGNKYLLAKLVRPMYFAGLRGDIRQGYFFTRGTFIAVRPVIRSGRLERPIIRSGRLGRHIFILGSGKGT